MFSKILYDDASGDEDDDKNNDNSHYYSDNSTTSFLFLLWHHFLLLSIFLPSFNRPFDTHFAIYFASSFTLLCRMMLPSLYRSSSKCTARLLFVLPGPNSSQCYSSFPWVQCQWNWYMNTELRNSVEKQCSYLYNVLLEMFCFIMSFSYSGSFLFFFIFIFLSVHLLLQTWLLYIQ